MNSNINNNYYKLITQSIKIKNNDNYFIYTILQDLLKDCYKNCAFSTLPYFRKDNV